MKDQSKENIRAVYDERSLLGETSGSNDFILKDLETKYIMDEIQENSRILEMGCGNGKTLINICREKSCSGVGLDFSSGMIELAKENLKAEGQLDITFDVGELPNIKLGEKFDIAISQRCLGNLPNRDDQDLAIVNIISMLKPGGKYVMIEDCMQSHDRLNSARSKLGLYAIPQPWFNNFLDEDRVAALKSKERKLIKGPIQVASTYYMLSRLIYAKLEDSKGVRPESLRYDSEINMLAYSLPNYGDLGAPTMWVWQKL